MDFLTVKEVAELKGCYYTYVQRLIKDGKLEAKTELNSRNKNMYLIPVSALPAELQTKYHNQKRREAGLLPELKKEKTPKKQRKNTVQKAFEDFSENERREILLWQDILREWQNYRAQYDSKTEIDPLYVGKCKLEHPDIEVSVDILYRKYAAYKQNDLSGLVDNRGGWNKGSTIIPRPVWDAFCWYWLDDNQPTVAECYRSVLKWTAEFYPELVPVIPTERSFRRHIDSEISEVIKTYMRDGDKAYKDKYQMYAVRLYDQLEANEVWIVDNHTFDIQSVSSDGSTHRLCLTTFQDAKSGVIVGWNITENPSVHSTLLALRHGIKRFGCPKIIYSDNGMEFLSNDFGGRKIRKHNDKPKPPTILKRLGIELQTPQVRNAKAKPIERTFGTLKNQFSRLFDGFCGGTILEKPETLTRRIRQGKIPRDYEIRDALEAWIDGDYNVQAYGGSERKFKAMSRIDVWNTSIKDTVKRIAEESDLNLMLMRITGYQKVSRNGVYVTVAGEKIWYYDIDGVYHLSGKEVYVRYDPAALQSVRIYDTEDRFICEWPIADYLYMDFMEQDKDKIADQQAVANRGYKHVKLQAKGIAAALTPEQKISRLALLAKRAAKNADKFQIKTPENVTKISNTESLRKVSGDHFEEVDVDFTRMADNMKKRTGKDEY